MLVQSTVLYFGETPVGYNLYKTEEGFALQPAPATESDSLPPVITATAASGSWYVEGVGDADVREQVIKLIAVQPLVDLPTELSAAS